jgi:hypothetical protein
MAYPRGNPSTERRVYLMQRLTNREITMEEATELFSIMSREMEGLRRMAQPPPPPPAPPQGPREEAVVVVSPTGSGGGGITIGTEEFLLMAGPFLGMLAAIVKKGSAVPPSSAPPSGASKDPRTPVPDGAKRPSGK